MSSKTRKIVTVSSENRQFPPPEDFSRKAHISSIQEYSKLYKKSIRDPEGYWESVANELSWFQKWDKVLDEGDSPFYKWFVNGKTNISYNCLDRHLGGATANKAALIWEGETGEQRTFTYIQLHRQVCRFANALKNMGIAKGDRVAIYLPMIPELVISVLACARIGAVHSVIFAGFSADSIRDRALDCQAKLIITADGGWRRGNILQLKNIVDEAARDCPCIQNIIVVRRGPDNSFPCHMKEGRDHWYHSIIDGVSSECEAMAMDSEDMLFLLYTSGTTGKPKGIMHTTGGYMVYTYITSKYVFDLKPRDVYWCTADIGWVTGHSYTVYGPLANAATVFIYEGAPNWPDKGRFWKMVEEHSVTIFYTAPTAIRSFMKWGDEWPNKYNLSSLRLLGTVGESINPEAWMWYHQIIGKGKCPIVDTWWQTETGGIMITPLPGCVATKPGSATLPFFGIKPEVLSDEGRDAETGILAVSKPWPGMLRGIYGDNQRYKQTYWSKWPGKYFPGDGAKIDKDGYYWILGRIDDVVNVAGHRIGTAELESAFVEHEAVAEAAVISIDHDIKGQCLVGFISLKESRQADDKLAEELKEWVAKKIGRFAMPERIIFAPDLPKTRSGKIMRRLLRDIAGGRAMGNITTLADVNVVEQLKKKYEED